MRQREIRDKKCKTCDNLILRISTWCLNCTGKQNGSIDKIKFINKGKFGNKHPRYKGGGQYVNAQGRMDIYFNTRDKQHHILRARKVMEDYVGRKLGFNEVVHHINGDKLDDRLENLQLISRSEHTSLHRPHQFRWGTP